MVTIHPTAVIDKCVEIGENVDIGPYCVIGEERLRDLLREEIDVLADALAKAKRRIEWVGMATMRQQLPLRATGDPVVQKVKILREQRDCALGEQGGGDDA